jgi:hypothetical protein
MSSAMRLADTQILGADTLAEALPSGRESGSSEPLVIGPFDETSVADLSLSQIACMSRSELIAAVRAARLPHLDDESARRLEFVDRTVLERLLHLGRRCCRNRGRHSRQRDRQELVEAVD